MIQFAWYSPELDTIVLHTFGSECCVIFEWDGKVLVSLRLENGDDIDPMQLTLWFPLGML